MTRLEIDDGAVREAERAIDHVQPLARSLGHNPTGTAMFRQLRSEHMEDP